MSLNINQARQSGFTIVELLIVVVVIAILAAITIVSYNGITQQAKASAAKSTAATFQKKAELYLSSEGRYPITANELNSSGEPYHLVGDGFVYGTVAPTSSNGEDTIQVLKCTADSPATQSTIDGDNISGLEIRYFDFDAGSGTQPLKLGTGNCPES